MAQVFLVSDYAATGSFSEVPETAIALDPGIYLFASLAVALVGCMIGAIELLYLNRRFAARTLATKLVGKTLIYAALLTGVILVTFPIAAAMEMNTSLTDGRVWQRLDAFFVSKTGLATGVQLTTSLVASLFYAEISEHMGPGVLMNFLTGRYHKPRVERRVFLFSDMKSSTSIAERLGHRQYFDLLRAYYAAMSDSIVNHGGEVYQYVGDEIVVSWPEHEGLRDSNCLRCVLSMKRALNRDSSRFLEAFGLVPDFKAGLQLGEVTTGEIGALKKQIVFSGDVLNQTARIQALCSGYDEEVLVGDELWARLDGKEEFEVRSLGHQVLRGKEQPVELFALDLEGVAA
ncbi:MAG: adenylate/guanylate cyclase domain-containing protein [Gemmatimonadetes bacterium]|nr:adenylate/guanylate cyclase domain-containing protein [Gemmatimonadota bacterium]